MASNVSLYDMERTGNDTVKFTTRCLPAWGAFRRVTYKGFMYVAPAVILLAALVSGQWQAFFGLLVMAALWIGLLAGIKWAFSDRLVHNKHRKPMVFTAGPDGIVIQEAQGNTVLALNDIERIYITAPDASNIAQYSVTSGFAGGKMFTGVSHSGGNLSAGEVSRSWQLIVQARGMEHWLAGGLTEPMAHSLQRKVQEALPIVWK